MGTSREKVSRQKSWRRLLTLISLTKRNKVQPTDDDDEVDDDDDQQCYKIDDVDDDDHS